MRVLLAEDDREISSAVKKVFEFNKYDMDIAHDGLEAYDMVYDNEYDVLIFDIMMPKMDGLTLVKKLRSEGCSLPIIMVTARSEIDDKVLGLDSGADDYLTKPFQMKELLARVRALSRRTGEVSESYKAGNVTLDNGTFELKAKTSVRLTSKEYKMMEFLIRNKSVLVSTERLMDAIWDYESEAEINVVWVYISALRKKLKQIGANLIIQAVRGVGYQLIEENA